MPRCVHTTECVPTHRELDEITYQRIADATLDELAEFFENLGDSGLCHRDFDVNFTVSDHAPCCIYVTERSVPAFKREMC